MEATQSIYPMLSTNVKNIVIDIFALPMQWHGQDLCDVFIRKVIMVKLPQTQRLECPIDFVAWNVPLLSFVVCLSDTTANVTPFTDKPILTNFVLFSHIVSSDVTRMKSGVFHPHFPFDLLVFCRSSYFHS